jgi:hypothetical protein
MTSLYVLSNEYQAIQAKLIESDFDEQTIADTLEGASGDLEAKSINVAMFVRNLESTAEAIKQAEKEMADRRKAIEKKAESIRLYLKDNMQRCGISKIWSPYFALTLKKNPPAVMIYAPDLIPAEFLVTPEPALPYPDKKAIADRLKSGEVVNGAHLVQAERLDIK